MVRNEGVKHRHGMRVHQILMDLAASVMAFLICARSAMWALQSRLLVSDWHTCVSCCRSQRETVLSSEPDRSLRPSFDQATDVTGMLQQRHAVGHKLDTSDLDMTKESSWVRAYIVWISASPMRCKTLSNPSGFNVPNNHLAIRAPSYIRQARS